MLKFRKIRFRCQISTTFIILINYTYNLILFSCAKFLQNFRKEIAISIYSCLLLIDRAPSRQNHRDFACPACITKPRISLSPITVVRLYRWSLSRAILTSIWSESNVHCDTFYKIYSRSIVEIVEQMFAPRDSLFICYINYKKQTFMQNFQNLIPHNYVI